MAHFYGTVNGSAATSGTRCGSKRSGMSAHIRGWDVGVAVELHYDADNDADVVRVYRTKGSRNCLDRTLIAEYSNKD